MDLLSTPKSELIRIIYEQQDRIAALEVQIVELRSRLVDQGSKDKISLPSWIKSNQALKQNQRRRGEREIQEDY